MSSGQYDIFQSDHGNLFSSLNIRNYSHAPFKDHTQFPILLNVLGRKDKHHVILTSQFSWKIHTYFLEALLLHLQQEHTPPALKNAELICIDVDLSYSLQDTQQNMAALFRELHEKISTSDKTVIVALTDIQPLLSSHHLREQLLLLMKHPRIRLFVFSRHDSENHLPIIPAGFTILNFNEPSEQDVRHLLKQERTEFENYHQAVIPDDVLEQAYILSERYLSTDNTLEQALLLLDSSAAFASAVERQPISNQTKPVVSMTALTQVLSGWTKIPATHLQLNKFKLVEFVQGMQQRIFGQDAAITLISHELQQSHTRLQQANGPFCSMLFAGAKHSGKRSATLALADQLFKQLGILYISQPASATIQSIVDLKLQRCTDKHYLSLIEVLSQTPYAILLIENIEHASAAVIDELQEILATGHLRNPHGEPFNFRQAILILTTSLGSDRLLEISSTFSPEEETQNSDLMHLIMHEQKDDTFTDSQLYTPQELSELVLPAISTQLPEELCHHLRIIPFMPLNKDAIEKIIKLKLKILSKQLDSRYGIELGFAPEVMRFLVSEVLMKQTFDEQAVDTDKVMKHVYFCVEQAVFSQGENKNISSQLFLQLNENGQSLRCDWQTTSVMRTHHS